jgi:hypothetical protein
VHSLHYQDSMMAALLSADLASQLQGAPTQQIAQHPGIDSAQASSAITAAIPLLLGALGNNASQPQGAQTLYNALQRDHAGPDQSGLDIGSVLGSVLGGGGQGGQILGHVFGNQQPRATQALGQSTGIGNDKANMLLRWLAPIAMAYLAKRVFDHRQASPAIPRGSAAASNTAPATSPTTMGVSMNTAGATTPTAAAPVATPQVVSDVLAPEVAHAQRTGGLLGAVLDRNGDGKVDFSDLLQAGSAILGDANRA